jgi:hypothetical protein
MKWFLIALTIMVTGCVSADVLTTYDLTKSPPELMSCHATYNALWHDTDAASFNVCGGSADTVGSKTSDQAPNIFEITAAMETIKKAKAAGVKIP